jgi:hypothetical protein
MPVLWGAFHSTRLVTITFIGVIGRQDIDACSDGIMTPATLSYRKLVDLTQGSLALSPDDVAALAERVREHGRAGALGAVAIVSLREKHEEQSLLFDALSTAAERPLKVFRDIQTARDWLDTIAPKVHATVPATSDQPRRFGSAAHRDRR